MANTSNSDKWYFTKEQLENTPSRKCGFDAYKELQYRQQAANFIQDMGQRLQVSQLCINTAIVYMHRFYVFHSFTNFPWHQMAAAALFLAAKVEEQPRKLEYVIRVANICKNPRDRAFDINSERYIAQSQDLVFNENVLLQTLGFDVAIDHPHTYVVRCCHLVRASKDLAQTSYFMASNSLHLTTMCIQYKPTVVACFCILLACKWSNWEIPLSNEKKEWFTYVDSTVTAELLQQLTSEFLVIFENCPSRLKEKIMAKQESSSSPFEQEKKPELRALEFKGDDPHKHRASRPPEAASSGHRSQEQREREYKERKEKERIAHMSGLTIPQPPHHHRQERPPRHPNSLTNNFSDVRQQRVDPSRSRIDPSKSLLKQDVMRRLEGVKDRTSQKVKSPYSLESKSVPKINSNQTHNASKPQFNGNTTNGSYNRPSMSQETDVKIKTETHSIKEEIPTPPVIKRPSLFSPEQTPHQHPQIQIKTEPLSKASSLTSLSALSPINSPPSVPSMRNRNYSSGSEPELRPTMKKIDQVEGFENLMRDSTIGIAGMANASDVIKANQLEECDIKTEPMSPVKDAISQSAIVNGLETNPTLISNLLKEVATTSHLPGVATTTLIKQEPVEPIQSTLVVPPPEHAEKEHRHHKSKKNKKEKHKHKDKSKEDKEKKKKHKDKGRERHKHKERKEKVEALPLVSEPIKITIQKDKIRPLNELKIKIPKDKIRTDGIVDLPQPSSGGLKIKIPKDIINNCGPSSSSFNSFDVSLSHGSSSRKRDRDRSLPKDAPPAKMAKTSHTESKNGRHFYSKVSKEQQPPSSDTFADASSSSSGISINEKSSSNNDAQMDVSDVNLKPSTPKDVSSTVVEMVLSPTLLSPISANESLLGSLEAPLLQLSPLPLSPISPCNSPPPLAANADNSPAIAKDVSTTPPGMPTTTTQKTITSDDVSAVPKYLEVSSTTFQPIAEDNMSNLTLYTSAPSNKFINHNNNNNNNIFQNTPYNNIIRFPIQHRPNNSYEYPPLFSKAKGYRAPPIRNNNNNMNPRYLPPRYPESTFTQMPPPSRDNPVHYGTPQMSFNAYQVAPPTLPNVSVPPPTYGLYPGYYGGFIYPDYPEMFHHQQQPMGVFGGVSNAQPPLPTDAPPMSEVPPPPPPE